MADRSGLDLRNISEEPNIRRGLGPLPFKPNDWNHVEVKLMIGQVLVQ